MLLCLFFPSVTLAFFLFFRRVFKNLYLGKIIVTDFKDFYFPFYSCSIADDAKLREFIFSYKIKFVFIRFDIYLYICIYDAI